ncbi:MAG: N-acetylneuraminate synthase [Deferrisomatales bacterium]
MPLTWLHDPENASACAIIAEVAQAHEGSLGMAHAFIDAIADAGADAVKFQTHIASAESTPAEPWRQKFSPQDETRYDYWRRMEFTAEQWQGLKDHAAERGLLFLSSPFSMEAFELLDRVGVSAWKVASGEINNTVLLDAILGTGLPVVLSTGMSPLAEVDEAVELVRRSGSPLAVCQCTSMYPCPPECVGLNVIETFRARYGCGVGLSDHSGTVFPGLAAAAQGIQVLEVHVTLSRQMFGPDVVASITTEELAHLVAGVRYIETMRAHPVDKAHPPEAVAPLRDIFMKSVVAAADLRRGTLLTPTHLALKKPGGGIPANRLASLVGRRLRRDVRKDARIAETDLD